MKPTRISSSEGSLNQIPATCTVQGDIRLIPFYKVQGAQRHSRRVVVGSHTHSRSLVV